MFMLYLKTLCPRKLNGGYQNFENWSRFSLVFVMNSKRPARDMVFWKRTIIMANEDDHDYAFWHKVASPTIWFWPADGMWSLTLTSSITTKRMSPFYITRQILLTHVANNWPVQFYPFIPRHFELFMKNPKASVSVSFEFGVDMSW